jgi:transcriptional regulator
VYVPEHFRESRSEVLYAFVAQHPLATLVANTAEGLTANHIPMLWLNAEDGSSVLRGHIARANPLWRLLGPGASVLAIFTGAQHYISPTWYPSKREDGKVVPTWNYAAVHMRGHIRFIDGASWLRGIVESLTDIHEETSRRERPDAARWHVSDAPENYIASMLHAIVGFEISIVDVEGKFKGIQNRPMADRRNVADQLRATGLPASQLAELVPGIDP